MAKPRMSQLPMSGLELIVVFNVPLRKRYQEAVAVSAQAASLVFGLNI